MSYSLQEALKELHSLNESANVTAVWNTADFDKKEFEDYNPDLMKRLQISSADDLGYSYKVIGTKDDVETFINLCIADYDCSSKEEAEETYGEGCIPTILETQKQEQLQEKFKISESNLSAEDLDSISNFIKGQLLNFTEKDGYFTEHETGSITGIKLNSKNMPYVTFDLLGGRNNTKRSGYVSLAGLLKGEANSYKGYNIYPPVYVGTDTKRSDKIKQLIQMYNDSKTKDELVSKINDALKVRYTGGNDVYSDENLQWLNDHVTSIDLLLGENETSNNRLEKMRMTLQADFPNVDIDDIAKSYNNDPSHVVAMKMNFSTKDLPSMPEVLKSLLSPSGKMSINNTNFIWELLRDHADGYPNLYLGFKR